MDTCKNSAKCFVCDVCEKLFTKKSNLNVHKKIYLAEKPYNCEVCDKTFTYKSTCWYIQVKNTFNAILVIRILL